MQYKIVALSALAATATAEGPHLAARQTKSEDLASCSSAIMNLVTDFPAVPSAIATATGISIGTGADSCDVSYPTALSSEVSSYASGISSWYSKNKDKVDSLTSACPTLVSGFDFQVKCASSFLGMSATTTGSSSSTSTGSSAASTTSSKGGAARETGPMLAAVAAAGLAIMVL